MLELGQPLHAYDLRKLDKGINVRLANAGEALTLLDGRALELGQDVLVIADGRGAVGLAGIMGGQSTAVSDATTDVFLEAAFFAPNAIAGRARRYGMHTDASMRFERGVDPSAQRRGIERATELLLSICGGQVGPLTITERAADVPQRPAGRVTPAASRRAARPRGARGAGLGPSDAPGHARGSPQRWLAGHAAVVQIRHHDRGRPDRRSGADGRLRPDPGYAGARDGTSRCSDGTQRSGRIGWRTCSSRAATRRRSPTASSTPSSRPRSIPAATRSRSRIR